MITTERIYEVFGINDYDIATMADIAISNYSYYNSDSLIKSSPKMLVALVNFVTHTEYRYTTQGGFGTYGPIYTEAIKAIESADNKKRKWPELLKELEK